MSIRVLGTGVAGLAAALTLSREDEIVLCGPNAQPASRVESLPWMVMGVLAELGIFLRDIPMAVVHNKRLVAWEESCAVLGIGPACVHLDRKDVWSRLAEKVRLSPRIKWETGFGKAGDIDATGRNAFTSDRQLHLAIPWVARTWTMLTPTWSELGTVALRDGYATRLGNGHKVTVTVVGSFEGDTQALASVREGWLGRDLPWECAVRTGAPASMQLATGDGVRIGDAGLAHEPLGARGLHWALIEAVSVRAAMRNPRLHAVRQLQRACEHRSHLLEKAAAHPFSGAPAWRAWRDALNALELNAPIGNVVVRAGHLIALP